MDTDVVFEGLLEKESGVFKKKSSVWVVLDTTDLSFYRPNKRSSCIGSVKINEVLLVRKTDNKLGNQFEVRTDSNSFLFNASDSDQADVWVNTIQKATSSTSLNSDNGVHKTPNTARSLNTSESTTKEVNDIPAASSTTFFGVKLRSSSRTPPTSPLQKNSYSTFKTYVDVNSGGIQKADTGKVSKPQSELTDNKTSGENSPVNTNRKPTRLAPPPPVRKDSLSNNLESDITDSSTKGTETMADKPVQVQKSPPSFKPPPPPVKADIPKKASAPKNTETQVCDKSVQKVDSSSFLISNHSQTPDDPESSRAIGSEKEVIDVSKETALLTENNQASPKTSESDSSRDLVTECEYMNVQSVISNDVEIRQRSDHSDVDTSGVQMRKSRRSHRNNSVNDSWATSLRVTTSKMDDNTTPVIQVDGDANETNNDEVFDLEKFLGSLKDPDHTNCVDLVPSADVSWKTEACVRLMTFLEEEAGMPFDVSTHRPTYENSVEKLRKLLNI